MWPTFLYTVFANEHWVPFYLLNACFHHCGKLQQGQAINGSLCFFYESYQARQVKPLLGWERISELAKQEILLHLAVKRCAPGLIEYPQTAYQFWEYFWGHTTPFPLCRGVYVQSKMKAHNGFEGGKWV